MAGPHDEDLFARLRAANQADWDAYVGHEFVTALAAGGLPEACFRHYLKQDYLFLIQFARAHALAAYKSESLADIRQAAGALSAIVDMEMELHVEYCAGWGLDRAALEAEPEAAQTIAYTRYVLAKGEAGDLLDLHVALAPCIIGYGEIAQAIATQTDGNPYRAWIDMYASDDYQAAVAAEREQLSRLDAARGGAGRWPALVQSFGQATRLEADFWQMGLDAAPGTQ